MAKAYFECATCNARVSVVGRNRSEADRKAQWHQDQEHICQACTEKQREADNAASAQRNAAAGLPELIGSEKQKQWAEKLREQMLTDITALDTLVASLFEAQQCGAAALDAVTDQIRPKCESMGLRAQALYPYWTLMLFDEIGSAARMSAFVELIKSETKASWWIARRDSKPEIIARAMRARIDAELM